MENEVENVDNLLNGINKNTHLICTKNKLQKEKYSSLIKQNLLYNFFQMLFWYFLNKSLCLLILYKPIEKK